MMLRGRSMAGIAAALGASDAWVIRAEPDQDHMTISEERRAKRDAERLAARAERERIEAERAAPHIARAEAKRAARRARNIRNLKG